MSKWLLGILDRLFVVVGALLFSQFPLYMTHYRQQLAGHVAELHLQIEIMKKAAQQSGKTLEQYVNKFVSSTDSDFARQGEIMNHMVQRWQDLASSLQSLDSSTIWSRPFSFISHFNSQIAKSTLNSFSMGLPINIEGVVYATLGIVIGYCFFHCIRKFFLMIHSIMMPKKSIPKFD